MRGNQNGMEEPGTVSEPTEAWVGRGVGVGWGVAGRGGGVGQVAAANQRA